MSPTPHQLPKRRGHGLFYFFLPLFCISQLERAREHQPGTSDSAGKSLFASAVRYLWEFRPTFIDRESVCTFYAQFYAFFCVVYSHDGLITRDKSQWHLTVITALVLVAGGWWSVKSGNPPSWANSIARAVGARVHSTVSKAPVDVQRDVGGTHFAGAGAGGPV